MRTILTVLALSLLVPAFAQVAEANQNPRRIGPFRLGMTANQFRSAAQSAGLRVRPEIMQERDVMGLALMPVMPVVAASSDSKPAAGKIWTATAYLLSGRVAYLDVFYGTEDVRRRNRWFREYNAPPNLINKLQDLTWLNEGVVTHTDRFGTRLAAVDWGGLKASDRVLVTGEGAVRVANDHFRRRNTRIAEASVDHIRQRVIEYYGKLQPGDDGQGCMPPPSTEYTPGESACDLEEKRFETNSPKWTTKPWAALGVRPELMSREHSFVIETSGTGRNTRIMIVAVGDMDCDQQVSTIRVTLRPDRNVDASRTCQLDDGTWEVINPLE